MSSCQHFECWCRVVVDRPIYSWKQTQQIIIVHMLEQQQLPCPVSAEERRESHVSRIRLQHQDTV